MAEIIQAAPLRAYDSNGDLVAGAKLFVFESGTTTELTVYQDEALTTPFAQPITADGAGVFDPIYAAAGTDAKVTITDADDVVLTGYPIDPVALGSTTASAAAQISFSPVTGNSATNVQAAIQNLTTLWNAVTTYSRTILSKATAAEWRTTLGLGGLATLDILDEDDFASDSATRPPSQQSTKEYIAIRDLMVPHLVASYDGSSFTIAAGNEAAVPLDVLITHDTSRIPGASLSSGDLVDLPAGDYYCEWRAVGYRNSGSGGASYQSALVDVTGAADLLVGSYNDSASFNRNETFGRGTFTLSTASDIRIVMEAEGNTVTIPGASPSFARTARCHFLYLWKIG